MMTAEVLQRRPVDDRAFGKAETVLEDLVRIGTGDRAHRIEAHREAALHRGADRVEIEERFHQIGVVGNRIDDRNRHARHLHVARRIEVDVLCRNGQPAVDFLRAGMDRPGHAFGSRAAVGYVVLDAEVLVRTAGVVARGEHEAAAGLVLADHVAGCRGREDTALADQDLAVAVGRGHADRFLDHRAVVKPPIAADHQHRAGLGRDYIENGLDEVLGVVRLLKYLHLLAQTGSTGGLTFERRGGNGNDLAQALYSMVPAAIRSARL